MFSFTPVYSCVLIKKQYISSIPRRALSPFNIFPGRLFFYPFHLMFVHRDCRLLSALLHQSAAEPYRRNSSGITGNVQSAEILTGPGENYRYNFSSFWFRQTGHNTTFFPATITACRTAMTSPRWYPIYTTSFICCDSGQVSLCKTEQEWPSDDFKK